MSLRPVYPTAAHAQAAAAVVDHFGRQADVSAVLLIGSTARAKATPDSCLDFLILVRPEVLATERPALERRWDDFYAADGVFQTLRRAGAYAHVDLDFIDGCFVPGPHGWTSGPDEFELSIGNALVYSRALWQNDGYLAELTAHWLPYYSDRLRQRRLQMVRHYCRNNLAHIPLYVERGLYFQCLQRLHHAFGEFLQALFIARRAYPIAYDKWIREQIEEILGLPEVYPQLPRLFEFRRFESRELAGKAEALARLLDTYTATAAGDDTPG